jgi:GTP-binding protein
VLLSKADKLNQAERAALLRESRALLGDAATVQVFSAHARMGVEEAQARMAALWRGSPE